jgi:hypothetical protein
MVSPGGDAEQYERTRRHLVTARHAAVISDFKPDYRIRGKFKSTPAQRAPRANRKWCEKPHDATIGAHANSRRSIFHRWNTGNITRFSVKSRKNSMARSYCAATFFVIAQFCIGRSTGCRRHARRA